MRKPMQKPVAVSRLHGVWRCLKNCGKTSGALMRADGTRMAIFASCLGPTEIAPWGCGQNLGPTKATGGSACTYMSNK